MPLTIFVTAYDRYAMKAFEVHALDYLLKPVGKERLAEARGARPQQLQHPPDGELSAPCAGDAGRPGIPAA